MTLIEDDVLRGMFAELAESAQIPPTGAADALAAIRAGRSVAPVTDLAAVRARRRKRLGAVVGVAAALLVVVGVAVSHSAGNSADHAVSVVPSAAAAKAGTAAAAGSVAASAAPAPARAAVPATTVPSVDADRVIRTGDVNLVVPKGTVAATVTKLQGAAGGLGGSLQDSQSQAADPKSAGVATASVTLRVPAPQFEALLNRVQALGKVITSTTSGKDVTAQYVDLAARLKALETSRETYLVILSKATTVNDTLAVQQRLDDLQQQIEQLQGQQNTLGAQSDLSTLTVEVSEPTPTPPPAPKPPAARSGLSQALHTAGDRFRRGGEAVIAALGTIALLLIATLGLLIIGRLGRRAYIRRTV